MINSEDIAKFLLSELQKDDLEVPPDITSDMLVRVFIQWTQGEFDEWLGRVYCDFRDEFVDEFGWDAVRRWISNWDF